MFNKIYVFFWNIFKKSYKSIIFILCFLLIATYPVPYYIFTSGGITDMSERFEVEGGYSHKGSYNLSYVTEVEGNILTYLAALVIPSWDLVKVESYQITSTESIEDLAKRDQLSLLLANQTAVKIAYEAAGKDFVINKNNLYVVFLNDFFESSVPVKVGDLIVSADGVEVKDFEQLVDIMDKKEIGDVISLELLRNNKETIVTDVKVKDIDGAKVTGLAMYLIYDYEVDPTIKFKFGARESGSSAGLMTTLAIYDTLLEEDLTNGYKIAGTGQIDTLGNVGEIGGVKYKLKGAVAKDVDIFFVPEGDNYEEAIELKKKHNYDIEIVKVKTFDDATSYLKSLKKEKD